MLIYFYLQTYNSPRWVLNKVHFKQNKQQSLSFHREASSNDFLLKYVDKCCHMCMYIHAAMYTTLNQRSENRALSAQPESHQDVWHTLESKSFLTLLPTRVKYKYSFAHTHTLLWLYANFSLFRIAKDCEVDK